MDSLDVDCLEKFVADSDTRHDATTYFGEIETPFKITATDFLKYAELDIGNKYGHHLVNVLSNSARYDVDAAPRTQANMPLAMPR